MNPTLPLKTKPLSKKFVLLAMLFLSSAVTFAQTLQQRQEILQQVNKTGLDSLAARLKMQHDLDEAKVATWLSIHPTFARSFEKNGSFYYLQRISDDGLPVYINTKSNRASAHMIGADQLYPGGSVGANIIGTGMVAGIWDGGQVRATHELLSGKVTMQAGQTLSSASGNDHMTHVSGTMVGKDIANKPESRGVAYGATSQNYDWDNDLTEMSTFASNGFLISNHSYGLANDSTTPVWQFGAYDYTAKTWDALTKTTPNYLPFVAAGNEQSSNGNTAKGGYDLISGSSAAKNVVTVGALNADSSMSDYSNWGPTDDGRFKPEIVTRGTAITSSYYATDNTYSTGDGTSFASPAAAAASLLLQQYYRSLTNAYMRSSTLKALLMHTAFDLGNPGPDYKFGWGLLSADKAGLLIKNAKPTSGSALITEYATNPINNGTDEMSLAVVANGTEPLKVSIAWIDDDGQEQTSANAVDVNTSRLVYNFDVMVKSNASNATTYPWRPMGMANRTANASKGTTWFESDNNNYRQVKIDNPTANGTYTIYIRKSSTSPATVRPFSLVVSGITASALPVSFVGISASLSGAANSITWVTATEDANTKFIIQQSSNGITFTDVATVNAKGIASTYNYSDANPLQTLTYYRIKIVEATGKITYSNIAVVRRNSKDDITLSPIPANKEIVLTVTNSQLIGTTATITDMVGRPVKKFVVQPYQSINISALPAGTYLLQTTNAATKFIKQ